MKDTCIALRRAGALAFAAALGLPALASAATLTYAETVMSGLANPRGLVIGPDGTLYVAEAGSGGTGAIIDTPVGQLAYGTTGGISQLLGGVQSRLLSGLPSLADPTGEQAHGPQDLAFGADGRLYVTIGLGADPAELIKLAAEPGAELVGSVAVIEGGVATVFADVAGFEAANDPNADGPDSNAFSIVAVGSGFVVTDAGGNSVLSIDATGAITVEAVLPNEPNPLGFGPPDYDAVPTGAILGAGGGVFFGQLTGFPFPPGYAQVFELNGGLSVLAGGLTNIIDVGLGLDGRIYALELDSDSLVGPGTAGALYAINADGTTELLIGGLDNPTGFVVAGDGSVYVSVTGFSPTEGAVIRLAPAPALVPLPATLPALAGGLMLLGAIRRRRR